jgi:putative molybdopterin biosynthesis protein
MHKVELTYALRDADEAPRELHHPLIALLDAIQRHGSISGAARHLQLSYRHVWGELKRWEHELGRTLVIWTKGQPATLAPFGSKLLWAERRAHARLAPQLDAMRAELERAFAVAFDESAEVIEVAASHDEALPGLREWAARHRKLHLDLRFSGSVEALAALNKGQAIVAGFHALTNARAGSLTAAAYRPLLEPGRHKLIGFATRTQGLIVAPGNPLGLARLADLARSGVRFVHREPGTGTRLVLEELLADAGVSLAAIDGHDRVEVSHRAVAQAVASGSADAAFGIEAAARARGLDFVPLAQERYFLATLAEHLDRSPLLALRAALASPEWQAELAALPGYAPLRSGEVLALTEVLPWWRWRTATRREIG